MMCLTSFALKYKLKKNCKFWKSEVIMEVMLYETKIAKDFWADVVNTICYVQNMIYISDLF